MKFAAVLILGPIGFIELVLRLIFSFFVGLLFLDDADDLKSFVTPMAWDLLRDLTAMKT